MIPSVGPGFEIQEGELGSGTAYRKHGQPTIASYRFNWKNVPDGKYSVTAKAHDFFGGSTTSAPVEFTVSGQNEPPTVVINVPKQDAIYKAGSARFNLQATAKDDGIITRVEHFLGTKHLGTSMAAPYSLYQVLSPGIYTFTAKATDHQGATTSSLPVTITVNDR
ncbi:MAG: Ig-like domain-containing protein [Planctomycetota bacterium]|nr:Ig-like domain-containing protein [Planctomycetota bacterium]